ncbi:unnamed protein product [Pleuronectes platessa]|uniref:Apolipoprotein B n=1 Tax=Pleuronectes platessa TaxID=8262 RepID=A0A9N7U512_PLEPL|nr:unnamed protein product [Pleuronectes platessa]
MGPFSYFKVDLRNEAETPFIKNSLLVASANANLHDLKAELKANHDTELYGAVSGVLSNGLNIVAHPNEFVFEFQNKGNAKVSIFDTLIAKIDLQNDYSATVKPDNQHLNTVAVARLNQYKMFYNLTVNNDQNEAALIVAMDGEANLDFLTSPISIPELDLPFVDFKTPAITTTVSVFEGLNAKLDGTTSLTTKRDSSWPTPCPLKIIILKALMTAPSLVKADFNIPMIKAVGKAEVDHSLKLEGAFEYLSMESSTRANMDGTVHEDTYLLSRVYAVLKYTSNNEADLFSFNTNGKHIAQATIDFAPVSSLIADIEIDYLSAQQSGTNLAAEVEGNAPVFKVTFKSSATSVIVFLEYDLDASTSATFEDEALNMDSKVVLTHSDMTMNVNHAIAQALRKRRQADDSVSHQTLNVDITSPTFTDMHIRFACSQRWYQWLSIHPTQWIPSLQLSGRVPSQMNARFYGRLSLFADKYQITTKISDLKDSVLNRINEAYAAAINL